MLKVIGLVFTILFLFPSANPQRTRFSQYKAVEAYEIRPGILMMPTYSDTGQVCEIGIQKRNYSPEIIRLDSGLSREEIDQVLEELVPDDERGSKSKELSGDLFTRSGPGITESIDFDNVSIQISAKVSPGSTKHKTIADDIAATVQWKDRKCK